jgi:hypothetical protein
MIQAGIREAVNMCRVLALVFTSYGIIALEAEA